MVIVFVVELIFDLIAVYTADKRLSGKRVRAK